MKIISYNVNGLKSSLTKGLEDLIRREDPDIVCLQEIKTSDQVDIYLRGYEIHLHPAKKKGYSGTAIFSKTPIKKLTKIHEEGRIMIAEYETFTLINVYSPNSQHGLKRLDYRSKFDEELYLLIKDYKNLILCGDLNVCHKDIDVKIKKSLIGTFPSTSDEERSGFELLTKDLTDVYRWLYPKKPGYTYLGDMNFRLDYFLVSDKSIVSDIKILDDELSDHQPVLLKTNIELKQIECKCLLTKKDLKFLRKWSKNDAVNPETKMKIVKGKETYNGIQNKFNRLIKCYKEEIIVRTKSNTLKKLINERY